MFYRDPPRILSISLLWLPCMFLFSLLSLDTIISLVILFVYIFAEIPLTPVSPPKQKD